MTITDFKPTELRGTDLLVYVLELIKDQEALRGAWDQGEWGRLMLTEDMIKQAETFEVSRSVEGHIRKEYLLDPALIEGQIATSPHCGTAMCFAGHTALLAGAKPIITTSFAPDPGEDWWFGTVRVQGEGGVTFDRHVSTYAQELLGLSESDAESLFSGDNTLDDLEHLVGEIVEHGEIVTERCYSGPWPWTGTQCGACGACERYRG